MDTATPSSQSLLHQKNRSSFPRLPDELWLHTFHFFDERGLCAARGVNKLFSQIILEEGRTRPYIELIQRNFESCASLDGLEKGDSLLKCYSQLMALRNLKNPDSLYETYLPAFPTLSGRDVYPLFSKMEKLKFGFAFKAVKKKLLANRLGLYSYSLQDAFVNACEQGEIETASAMIELGAKINSDSDSANSPLKKAALKGHLAIVNPFIEKTETSPDERFQPL